MAQTPFDNFVGSPLGSSKIQFQGSQSTMPTVALRDLQTAHADPDDPYEALAAWYANPGAASLKSRVITLEGHRFIDVSAIVSGTVTAVDQAAVVRLYGGFRLGNFRGGKWQPHDFDPTLFDKFAEATLNDCFLFPLFDRADNHSLTLSATPEIVKNDTTGSAREHRLFSANKFVFAAGAQFVIALCETPFEFNGAGAKVDTIGSSLLLRCVN